MFRSVRIDRITGILIWLAQVSSLKTTATYGSGMLTAALLDRFVWLCVDNFLCKLSGVDQSVFKNK